MISDNTLDKKSQLKDEISRLIFSNFSAVNLIAEQLEINDDLVTSLIAELVEEGTLNGRFTPDGLRFYRSDIKMPIISEEEDVVTTVEKNHKMIIPKAIITSGIALFIAGQILIRMFAEEIPMHNTAAGMVMMGLITIFGGLFSVTKLE